MSFTNPGSAVGTNGAYRGRTSVNAFNDILSVFNGRGIIKGWPCVPAGGLTLNLGGSALIRDVAVAENDLGQRTTINNISNQPIPVTLDEAPTLGGRIDVIVAFVNNPPDMPVVTPIPVDNPDVCGLIVVKGNVSNNPVVPDETMIRAAITADGAAGSTAYYVVLGTVAVPAGVTTITPQLITQGTMASIGATSIADGTITTQKLADGAVTGAKIADGTIESSNMDWTTVQNVVDRAKMANNGAGLPFYYNNIKVAQDTALEWVKAFGSARGIYYASYNLEDCFPGQPQQYGILITEVIDAAASTATVYQKWHPWMGTAELLRFGNQPNSALPAWKKPNS